MTAKNREQEVHRKEQKKWTAEKLEELSINQLMFLYAEGDISNEEFQRFICDQTNGIKL